MAKVLIPFAEPEGARRAVCALIREPFDPALSVHLVAVVEPLRPGKVAAFVTAERAQGLVRDAARRWLAQLAEPLAAARISVTSEAVLGPAKPTIAALAQRRDVDRVMLPAARGGGLSRRAGLRIRDLSPHPVTLVT